MDPLDAFMESLDSNILIMAESNRHSCSIPSKPKESVYDLSMPQALEPAVRLLTQKVAASSRSSMEAPTKRRPNGGNGLSPVQEGAFFELLLRDPPAFLIRHGHLMDVFDLKVISQAFEKSCPEVQLHVRRLRQLQLQQGKTACDKTKQYRRPPNTQARNRRYRYLQRLLHTPGGDPFFGDEAIQDRAPHLFYEHVGQYLGQQQAPIPEDQAETDGGEKIPGALSFSSYLCQSLQFLHENENGQKSKEGNIMGAPAIHLQKIKEYQPENPQGSYRNDCRLRNDSLPLGSRRDAHIRFGDFLAPESINNSFPWPSSQQQQHQEKQLHQQGLQEGHKKVSFSFNKEEHATPQETRKSGADKPANLSIPNSEQVSPKFLEKQRQKLEQLLIERFLDGADFEFIDYGQIDGDPSLDDLEEVGRRAEESYFDGQC